MGWFFVYLSSLKLQILRKLEKQLHLVTFGNPDPPNYGGVIDVHYKVKALSDQGIKVNLHFFHEGHDRELNGLSEHCSSYQSYWRKTGVKGISPFIPYIVYSRRSRKLLENLSKDNHPILFEGLHSTMYLAHPALKDRLKMVRTHNKEHLYYQALADNVSIGRDSFYFQTESYLLKKYEKVLQNSDVILAISKDEKNYFERYQQTIHLPCFHQYKDISIESGRGDYALYHGDLSVPKNEKEAIYFIDEVFSKTDFPFVVTGLNPTEKLRSHCEKNHVTLVENPSSDEMKKLIKDAHILVLKTEDSTGIKLKWIHSLFSGRHVIANRPMLNDKNLRPLCHEANSTEEYLDLIESLRGEPFTPEAINTRKATLEKYYNNQNNAKLIVDLLS